VIRRPVKRPAGKARHSKIGKKSDFIRKRSGMRLGAFVWSTVLPTTPKDESGTENWADFWNVSKFPGKRGMRKGAATTWNSR